MKIVTTRLESPLGIMLAGASEEGICFLEFTDESRAGIQLAKLEKFFGTGIVPGDSGFFPVLGRELTEYFERKRRSFTIPIMLSGTGFQKKVWNALLDIPYGETRSYLEQASSMGRPEAVRAVAGANGKNPIGIIVPCHRVIGSDGQLVGYGAGLWRKKFLLELESGEGRGR